MGRCPSTRSGTTSSNYDRLHAVAMGFVARGEIREEDVADFVTTLDRELRRRARGAARQAAADSVSRALAVALKYDPLL